MLKEEQDYRIIEGYYFFYESDRLAIIRCLKLFEIDYSKICKKFLSPLKSYIHLINCTKLSSLNVNEKKMFLKTVFASLKYLDF